MYTEKYQPDEDDITTAQEMLNAVPEGRAMFLALTKLIYRVSHIDKRLILLNSMYVLRSDFSRMVHERVKVVFKQVGYDVVEGDI